MAYVFQFSVVADNWLLLLHGAWLTVRLTAMSIVLGSALAIVCAYALLYGRPWVRAAVRAYVEAIRNTPLLAQLFLAFFGLSQLGLRLSADQAALLGITLNLGAYATEIIRAGTLAVGPGQREAGAALGLSRYQTFRLVVLRPALAAIYPALASQYVLIMLGSSIVSAISAEDLSSVAAVLQTATFRAFEIYLAVTVLYLGLTLLMRQALLLAGRRAFSWVGAG